MSKNKNMHKARKEKNDEFYTLYEDIEKEVLHYKDQFKDKIVYCNCDNPDISEFCRYFEDHFDSFGLNRVISTFYDESVTPYKLELEKVNGKLIKTKANLNQNGDFRSQECIDILKEADIVVTNPPFSLFREYIAQLIEYDKKFLIIGNQGAVIYKDIFSLFKENKVWFGVSPRSMNFKRPDGSIESVNASWFTNLEHTKRYKKRILYKLYEEDKESYQTYLNFDAINIDKAKNIPKDYNGIMGVPITFLDSVNPDQFEIVGSTRHSEELQVNNEYINLRKVDKNGKVSKVSKLGKSPYIVINTKPQTAYCLADNIDGYIIEMYQRLLIRRKES